MPNQTSATVIRAVAAQMDALSEQVKHVNVLVTSWADAGPTVPDVVVRAGCGAYESIAAQIVAASDLAKSYLPDGQ